MRCHPKGKTERRKHEIQILEWFHNTYQSLEIIRKRGIMKRTIHTSQQLDEYIEQEKEKGKSPSTVVNELFDEYVKMKNKEIIARSSNQ